MNLETRIKEIKERMGKATPTDGTISFVEGSISGEIDSYHIHTEVDGEIIADFYWDKENDCRFYAHSRSDIEFLVEALEIALDKIKDCSNDLHYEMCHSHGPEDCFKKHLKELEELAEKK